MGNRHRESAIKRVILAAVPSDLPSSSTAAAAYVPPGPRERIIRSAREHVVPATLRSALAWGTRFVAGPHIARRVRGRPSFSLGADEFAYRDDWHNWTWLNERAVEIPIAAAALDRAGGRTAIEVGAVMTHYGDHSHRVVDKYEVGAGIERIDIFDLAPAPRYDLVLSVSTLEHVGWDEPERDGELALRAAEHLKTLVAPGGELLITVPVDYHPRLDAAIRSGELQFDEVRALRCHYPSMIWREVDPSTVDDAEYDTLIYRAEAVLICRWTNHSEA